MSFVITPPAVSRPSEERGHIEQEQILYRRRLVACQDRRLHRSTVRHGLIRVDGAVRLLAVEELLDQALHLRDTRRPTDKHDVVDRLLVQAAVTHRLLHRAQGVAEVIHAELLEAGAGDVAVVVNAVEERVDLDGRLGRRRKRALRTLALGAETADRALVTSEVLTAVLALEVR